MLRQAIYYDQLDIWKKLFSLSQKGHNFKNLMPIITSDDNIMLAYRMLKENKGSNTPGVDRITIKQVKQMGLQRFIRLVRNKLNGEKPKPIRRKLIPKNNDKMRVLGISALLDRMTQQAIKQALEPIFEAKFHEHSYGYRPGKSQEHAIAICEYLIHIGYTYAVNIDIEAYFDNIDHSKLLKILWANGIRDKRLLSAIKGMLKTPIIGVGIPKKGCSQGSVLSPLLANVYLNELDQWIDSQWRNKEKLSKYKRKKLKQKRGIIVRFADDLNIFARNRSEAVKWFHATKMWLKERLRLNCSVEKSGIINLKKKAIKFLGIEIKAVKSRNNGRIYARKSIPKEKKKKIARNITKGWKALAKSFPTQKRKWLNHASWIGAYIRSTRDYYSICNTVYKDLAEVDHRTHRARAGILENRPKLKELMRKIYRRACHRSLCDRPKKPESSSLTLSQNAKFRLPKSALKDIIYQQDVKIRAYQMGLNTLRAKVKAWGGNKIEKADICLSLYTQQRGRNPITGSVLIIEEVECHRIDPDGVYTFRNCVLLDKWIHNVIHGTKANLDNYIRIMKPNKKRLNKLLKLWSMAHRIYD